MTVFIGFALVNYLWEYDQTMLTMGFGFTEGLLGYAIIFVSWMKQAEYNYSVSFNISAILVLIAVLII